MVLFATVERSFPGSGRNSDKTYRNVVTSVRSSGASWADILVHPKFSDPQHHQFAIQLTQNLYDILREEGALFHDGFGNLPRVQQRNTDTGSATELGSFFDPEDLASAWIAQEPIPDDRRIVRIYKAVPPGLPEDHIGSEDLEEGQDGGVVTRWLRLFTPSGAVVSGPIANQQNVKYQVAGRNMIFDTGSQAVPPLPAGCATFGVPTSVAGQVVFPSSSADRVVGPNGEKSCRWQVYGRVLRAL